MAVGNSLWGGKWTDRKLAILKAYLEAYVKILPPLFTIGYIDAFAGTGKITSVAPEAGGLFDEPEVKAFRVGSARIALEIEKPFDFYVFIEASRKKLQELNRLEAEFSELNVRVRHGDANKFLQSYAEIEWKRKKLRAVVFLDPYGMQVDWKTLEALAATQAVDVWLLVPMGIGPNRLLPRQLSAADPSWLKRLDRFFGTPDWRDHFYESAERRRTRTGTQQSLFAEEAPEDTGRYKAVTLDDIAAFFLNRLRDTFPHVAPNPRLLHNSRGNPLYMLCFACANPSKAAGRAALNVAEHLLSDSFTG
jgi:three-Cys-motif partner protein